MLSRKQAISAAEAFLAAAYAEDPVTIVVDPGATREHGWAWAVAFDSQEYLATGDLSKRPVSRLLVVPKDGSAPRFVPTPFTYQEAMAYLATGRRPGEAAPAGGARPAGRPGTGERPGRWGGRVLRALRGRRQ